MLEFFLRSQCNFYEIVNANLLFERVKNLESRQIIKTFSLILQLGHRLSGQGVDSSVGKWLNLWDECITTGRINQIVSKCTVICTNIYKQFRKWIVSNVSVDAKMDRCQFFKRNTEQINFIRLLLFPYPMPFTIKRF